MKTPEFTELIKTTDGYFVLVTREKLDNLPYSIRAIYRLSSESKYNEYKQEVTINILLRVNNIVY